MLKRSTDYIDYNEDTDHNDYTTPSYISYMTTLTTLTTPSPPPDPCGAHPPRVREWRHMTFQTSETASLNSSPQTHLRENSQHRIYSNYKRPTSN